MTHSCAFFAFMEPLNLSKKAHHLRALLQVKIFEMREICLLNSHNTIAFTICVQMSNQLDRFSSNRELPAPFNFDEKSFDLMGHH